MKQPDVNIAIAETFCKLFKDLKFGRDLEFVEIDRSMPPLFQLTGEFEGRGKYDFTGLAKLFIENNGFNQSARYDISGTVEVSEEDDSPDVEFVGLLSARKV
ncbi:MAG: hypothetical protein HDS06_09085 [Bacteroides sp.]|nr:hypothetical protein [Bacteroides sp.]